jgi:D-alanine-D-alanine ligase
MAKLRVGILFGGRSGEHEVSLLSAASVVNAIDKTKYEVVPIGITKDGRWLTAEHAERLLKGKGEEQADKSVRATQPAQLRAGDPEATPGAAVLATGESVVVPPEPARRDAGLAPFQTDANLRRASDRAINVDVIFPVLHGTFGEDGTIQGLLELADIAYVGAGVLGSSAGMDKDIMKSLFRAAGLPIVKHVTVLRGQFEGMLKEAPKKVKKLVESTLKYPVFVKPANLGSSVGISKAHDRKELGPAIAEAAKFDRKIVIEEGVGGKKHKAREIECAVLGNDDPKASIAGEIVPCKEFYDYDAKYLAEGSELMIPAKITKAEMKTVQRLAIAAFQAVDCMGLARVDFLMDPKSRKIYVNEINTMPGFTAISMYPKLWAASGVTYPELIDRLIRLGMERHEDKKRNQYSR